MALIELKDVSYVYGKGTAFEKTALKDINLTIEKGEFIGLIGHTGSGKSTLVQQLNGLLSPHTGSVLIKGKDISKMGSELRKVRQKIGLVFQYPEYQLFEETISKDIAFGPRNQGLNEEDINERVKEAMESVGLSYEKYKDKSPFNLSGGQKRRVAIAGVLAMKPEVLILDEPTAGLDPEGREEILGEIKEIYKKGDITIVIVSHSMEDMAKIAERIIVMKKGEIFMDDKPKNIFAREEELLEIGLGVPQVTRFMKRLKDKGLPVDGICITVEEAKAQLEEILRGKKDV
ncbi:energy-coupling factor transporter ATPase [Peptoniphilus catoniae]|uniref:energy-coupling factor transporter ATPase n=1 Tax=Peptoniphilus catoniae TaxID=1660341 RepID=UPI0010FD3F6C|nr:energy-coupling factor transporter ATPase [Peptoniphilus catoniae]